MKAFIVILLVIFIFLACGTFGYYLAQNSPSAARDDVQKEVTPDGNFEDHRFLIFVVDQLNVEKPELVSVWFVSLYFAENSRPTITFAQLYSPNSSTESALNLERTFALDAQGEPAKPFLKAISAFRIEWEAYFIVDQLATQHVFQWVNGPGDYPAMMNGTQETNILLQQTCDALGKLANREAPAFDWTVIAPAHFGSSIRMENAMDYWNQITKEDQPPRCEVILAQ